MFIYDSSRTQWQIRASVLSSVFLEITWHIVRLSLHGPLFLLSTKVSKPQRFLGVLCCTCNLLPPAQESSGLDSAGSTSVPLHHLKQYLCSTATEKLLSWTTFAVFIVHQVTFTSCQTHPSHTCISARALHDPDAYRTGECWAGVVRGTDLFFPSLVLFFSPLDVFSDSIVALHCCATETLDCDLMMCVYCVPEIELMTVTSNCLQREMSRSGKDQKNFQR